MTPDTLARAQAAIDAARKRADAATAGPWHGCSWDAMHRPHAYVNLPGSGTHATYDDLPVTGEDAAFIAAARNDVPALADAADALCALVATGDGWWLCCHPGDDWPWQCAICEEVTDGLWRDLPHAPDCAAMAAEAAVRGLAGEGA